jgi:transglutaminase-like putative cysteine protease
MSQPPRARRSKLGIAITLTGWLLKLAFAAIAVLLPLGGVWIASSLAAHHDGPLWASIAAGALCFPLLPLAWDLLATWRRNRGGRVRRRVLTPFDRLLLRTLAVNLVFVGGLLATFPASVFEALSTRGDWMLPQGDVAWAQRARQVLFDVAERTSWLHEATHENAYEGLIDPALTKARTSDGQPPKAGEVPTRRSRPTPAPSAPKLTPADLHRTDGWPFAPTLHPLVSSLPPEAETSIQSVARYIMDREPDPVQRAKALHDYVADRVAYDVAAYHAILRGAHEVPPQDAQSVFERRTAVCAGSAALLAELGRSVGIEIVVVVGDARNDDGLFEGIGHAWNAIDIDGRWYLADPTWDAGHVEGDRFTKEYTSSYFMAPPEVFVASHMPEDPKWQLLPTPLSQGDFIRQPHLRPGFAALDLRLLEPTRAHVAVGVGQSLTLRFDNPHGFELAGDVRVPDGGLQGSTSCELDETSTVMQCTFPEAGRRHVSLFGRPGGFLGRIYVDVG